MALEAFFLPTASGQLFCLFHPAEHPRREQGAVLFIHPFAEEMNKSRRMAALQSRALAAAGYHVLQLDLRGCGDSQGDFAGATWTGWMEDVETARTWLRTRTDAPLWLWGLRTGCLAAAAAAARMSEAVNFLFWQPVVSGRLFLQQFLRLKLAGALVDGDAAKGTQELRRQLSAGEAVEVAGYSLAPSLAQGLDGADLVPASPPGRLEWLEVSSRQDASLAPASEKCLKSWQQAGFRVRSQVVAGQSFWHTVETTECSALLQATLDTLQEPSCQ